MFAFGKLFQPKQLTLNSKYACYQFMHSMLAVSYSSTWATGNSNQNDSQTFTAENKL